MLQNVSAVLTKRWAGKVSGGDVGTQKSKNSLCSEGAERGGGGAARSSQGWGRAGKGGAAEK